MFGLDALAALADQVVAGNTEEDEATCNIPKPPAPRNVLIGMYQKFGSGVSVKCNNFDSCPPVWKHWNIDKVFLPDAYYTTKTKSDDIQSDPMIVEDGEPLDLHTTMLTFQEFHKEESKDDDSNLLENNVNNYEEEDNVRVVTKKKSRKRKSRNANSNRKSYVDNEEAELFRASMNREVPFIPFRNKLKHDKVYREMLIQMVIDHFKEDCSVQDEQDLEEGEEPETEVSIETALLKLEMGDVPDKVKNLMALHERIDLNFVNGIKGFAKEKSERGWECDASDADSIHQTVVYPVLPLNL